MNETISITKALASLQVLYEHKLTPKWIKERLAIIIQGLKAEVRR